MTIKEREDTSIQIIRNINMAKGILQRRNTCDTIIPASTHNHGNSSNNNNNIISSVTRRSFRILGPRNEKREPTAEKQREIKQARTSGAAGSPDTGRRNISVARVAEAFHELQQKLITRTTSRHNDENDASSKNTNALLKFELSKKSSQVSKKINMFNRSTKSGIRKENGKDNNSAVYIESKRSRDGMKNMNKKLKHDDVINDVTSPGIPSTLINEQNKIIVSIENGLCIGKKHDDISEEEMLFIRKRKAIGRSNSAMIPLRELVMTREVANSRRSLSLSLIPEDETLSLLEAVERRLNLSKETNLCDTVL